MKILLNGVRIGLSIVCTLVCSLTFAQAPGFGGAELKADNKQHYACWAGAGGYPPEAVTYYNWWQIYNEGFTGLEILPITPNSCPALTDMKMNNTLKIGGVFGLHTCVLGYNDPFDGWVCLEGQVEINHNLLAWNSLYLNYPFSHAALVAWCHEIGHSYGIHHAFWPGSCTYGDPSPSAPTTYTNDELLLMQFYIP